MGHAKLQFFLEEARHELLLGLRSPLIPLAFVGLSLYMVLILLNADYMRQMGAVDIPRNSSHVNFLMGSGQSLWLYFAWAWVFAQVVVRDQTAQLQEIVLAAPLSLRGLLLARFFGACVVALILGVAVYAGLLLAPLLVPLGLLPPEAVGPIPALSMVWAFTIFTAPNALACGAIFFCAAIWTRSITGPFSAAAVIAMVWMVAMIVLRGGDVDVMTASVIDPSGYSEAERQANAWTPVEKRQAMLEPTTVVLLNRGLWLALGLALMAFTLWRVTREDLAIGKGGGGDRAETVQGAKKRRYVASQLPSIHAPLWWRAALSECVWQVRLSLAGFGLRLALVMLALMGVIGCWVNFVGHVDGPLVATPQGLLPFMAEFYYVIIVCITVGFVGTVMRRDDRPGFGEWVDSARAPIPTQLVGKCLAGLLLVATLCLVPALAAFVVTGLSAPASFDLIFPLVFMFLTMFPALAELAGLSMLAHAVLRHAGSAYVVSILFGFIAIVNHEMSIAEYPPAQFGIPADANVAELVGWSPWLPMLFTMTGFKLGIVAIALGLVWVAWQRGTALTLRDRWLAAGKRVLGGAGVAITTAVFVTLSLGTLLQHRFVDVGDYESTADGLTKDAQWEKRWWAGATPFVVRGGHVDISLQPHTRSAVVDWRLNDLKTTQLNGTLPTGVELLAASSGDEAQTFDVANDHFAVQLPQCDTGCELHLSFRVELAGWPVEQAPWLHETGVWLRAQDLLPRLGHDPERLVRSRSDRKANGLLETLPPQPVAAALAAADHVAPTGDWSWRVQAPGGELLAAEGRLTGPLSFASIWLPALPQAIKRGSTDYRIGPARQMVAAQYAADIDGLYGCVESRLGDIPDIQQVVQVPRGLGDVELHGGLLWAPEDLAWDSDGTGTGSWRRQFITARAFARAAIHQRLDLRAEAGARWLLAGLSGWTALQCVEALSGADAALALRGRAADDLAEAFATSANPITPTADSFDDWLSDYATLALDSWSAGDEARSPRSAITLLALSHTAMPLADALSVAFGENDSATMLGMPSSADIAVVERAGARSISAQRWVWDRGGWVSQPPVNKVALRTSDSKLGGWISIDAPQPAHESGMLIDASPRFERTLEDNVY